jgi:energy-converting hydrogenase Eha subunit E
LLFVVLAGMALWLLGARGKVIVRGLRADPSDMTAAVLASCGLGLLAVTLHSLVDFNLHIPANAILAAFLMGAFLRLQATDAQVEMRRPSTDMAGH